MFYIYLGEAEGTTPLRSSTRAKSAGGGPGTSGYLNSYPVERSWRNSRICGIYEGMNEIQKLIIARHAPG